MALAMSSISQQRLKFSLQKQEVELMAEEVEVMDRMTFQANRIPPSDLVSELEPIPKVVYPTVDLSNENLKTIPFELCAESWKAKYDLSDNRIKKLGRRFGKLSTDTLIVCRNNIGTITPHGLYRRLVYLDLSFNQLSAINLSNRTTSTRMSYLDLSFNQLDHLPHDWRIPRLKELFLGHNNLDALPSSFKYCSDLLRLDISQNEFRTVPDEIYRMKKIQELDLSHNDIHGSILKLKKLKNLKKLNLKGNPLDPRDVERLQNLLPDCEIEFEIPELPNSEN